MTKDSACIIYVHLHIMWYFKVAIDSASGYNRLVDDVFSRICQAINDVQESVRCLAAQTIGSMAKVKRSFCPLS